MPYMEIYREPHRQFEVLASTLKASNRKKTEQVLFFLGINGSVV